MAKIIPVDRGRLAGKGWRRPAGYNFAKNDAVISLVASEFPKAALTLPIGFVEQSGFFVPVMLTSPFPGRNVVVGPNGEWFANYVPAVLRAYPFSLRSSAGGEPVLCVDEDSGLVAPADNKTEKFFSEDGSLSPPLSDIVKLLRQLDENRIATNRDIVALSDAGVLKRWPLVVPVGNRQVPVNGLYTADDTALNALDDAAFIGVRRALALAYTQLVSTGQMSVLSRLALLQEKGVQAMQKTTPPQ